jgi:hypothetical protein
MEIAFRRLCGPERPEATARLLTNGCRARAFEMERSSLAAGRRLRTGAPYSVIRQSNPSKCVAAIVDVSH